MSSTAHRRKNIGSCSEETATEAAEALPRFGWWYTNICVGAIIELEVIPSLRIDSTNPKSVKFLIISNGTFSIHLGVTFEFIVEADFRS
jgi:hypothetical protein